MVFYTRSKLKTESKLQGSSFPDRIVTLNIPLSPVRSTFVIFDLQSPSLKDVRRLLVIFAHSKLHGGVSGTTQHLIHELSSSCIGLRSPIPCFVMAQIRFRLPCVIFLIQTEFGSWVIDFGLGRALTHRNRVLHNLTR